MVRCGFPEYVRKTAHQQPDYTNVVVVACGTFFYPKGDRHILQFALNMDDDCFSNRGVTDVWYWVAAPLDCMPRFQVDALGTR